MTAEPNPSLGQWEVRAVCGNCGHGIYTYIAKQTGEFVPPGTLNPWMHLDTYDAACSSPLTQIIGDPVGDQPTIFDVTAAAEIDDATAAADDEKTVVRRRRRTKK